MDVLSGISVDTLKFLGFVIAGLISIGVYFAFFKKWQWALVGAVFTYLIWTTGIGLYVLLHVNDPRWSGEETSLQAPAIADTPIIGQYMQPLNDFLNSTASSINDFVAFQHALPVAQEFFGLAGWALAILVPVVLFAVIYSRIQAAIESAQQKDKMKKMKAAIRELQEINGLDPLK
jgi:hypothetical protein